MRLKTNLLLLTLLLTFPFYAQISPLLQTSSNETVTYTESDEDFMNPDRGFYYPISTSASNFTALDVNQLIAVRTNEFTPWQGNYQVRASLIFRYYVLDDFVNAPISNTFLNQLQTDFNTARQAGVRLVIRFNYTITADNSCGDTACPPYGDATEARILEHIGQLKPLFQSNSDVLAAVQSGFIGIWGEQYYTDHFGDATSNGDGKITDANWIKRNNVLAALLDAVPANRMVQVRYPQLIQRFIYGTTAPVTSAALSENQAHQGTDIARLGLHNDCFLASADDFGTFWDYGSGGLNSGTAPSNQTAILKPYAGATGKYTAIGGETCWDGFSPENDCSGQARTDMAALHYSYLNSDYNNAVNNDWETDGCMDEIKKKLGYRFVLQDATYPSTADAGTTINFTLNLNNIGYAAPFNERQLLLILRHTTVDATYLIEIGGTNTDSRFWHTGAITVSGTAALFPDMPQGDYALLLHFRDESDNHRIGDRPEYSIRLANENMWEAATGYNDLNHILTINDASLCEEGDIDLTGSLSTSETYETQGTITSTQNITGSPSVVYDAQDAILLNPDFSVVSTGSFLAFIDGCEGTAAKLTPAMNPTELTTTNLKTASNIQLGVLPNPFEHSFEINYDLEIASTSSLLVLDMLGRVVEQPVNQVVQGPGHYTYTIATSTLPNGFYYVSLKTRGIEEGVLRSAIQKVVKL